VLTADPRSCTHHGDAPGAFRCQVCARPFCENCVVSIRGRRVCAECKPGALRDLRRRIGPLDRDADEALAFSLIGAVPFLVPVVAPIALCKGLVVLRAYRRDPSLPNRWKAVTAVAVSAGVLVLAAFIVAMLVPR
jgi:hypothetical protein